MKIKFGTDGWRAVIGSDYNDETVSVAAQGTANYIHSPEREKLDIYSTKTESQLTTTFQPPESGILIGYDTRLRADEFARLTAKILSANGIPVTLSDSCVSTPALSLAVRNMKAAGGIMITASHNPARWCGFKFKAEYGSSGLPEIMELLQKEVDLVIDSGLAILTEEKAPVKTYDFSRHYLDRLKELADIELIAQSGFTLVADPMFGAARKYFPGLFEGCKDICCNILEIRNGINPGFGGDHPEPIPPHVQPLIDIVKEIKADAGFAFDGDGDRIGAVDSTGRFLSSHDIFSLLLVHMVENKGLKGTIVKSVSTTGMIDKLAEKYDLPLIITPVGFKHTCREMLTKDVLIGGEESGGIGFKGHIPERDGILSALYLLEFMSVRKKPLAKLMDDLFALVGPHYTRRIDTVLTEPGVKEKAVSKLSASPPMEFAGIRVKEISTLDGYKFFLENGNWILFRISGTEPMIRIYAESASEEETSWLLESGRETLGI